VITTKHQRTYDGKLIPYYQDSVDDRQYGRIIAGATWPEKHNGYLVVVGRERKTISGKPILRCLFEIDAPSVPRLFNACSVARSFYCVSQYYGDTRNRPMQQYWASLNDCKSTVDQIWLVEAPYIREKETNWRGYLEAIDGPLSDPVRLFFGPCSNLMGKLAELPKDVAEKHPEDFPPVTALAYAVAAMELIE
jgi:hypothetical protein